MDGLLAGETAIVTGSSRGIGRAIAIEFARHGAAVVVNYLRSRPEADAVVASVEEIGGRARAIQASVGDRSAVEKMFAEAEEQFGPVDILVNNAGIVSDSLFMRMGDEQWDRVLNTNLKGAYNCCKAALTSMYRRRTGRIINVSSLSGQSGRRGQSNYAASKGALVSFTKSLAQEVGPFGIRVNAISPGPIETDLTAVLAEDTFDTEDIPLRRIGRPEDVARVAVFLASDLSNYVTGTVINVNGGLYM